MKLSLFKLNKFYAVEDATFEQSTQPKDNGSSSGSGFGDRATYPILYSLELESNNYWEQHKEHCFQVVAVQETGENGKTIKAINQGCKGVFWSHVVASELEILDI